MLVKKSKMKNTYFKYILLDVVSSISAIIISFLLRFDFIIPHYFQSVLLSWIPLFISVQTIVFYFASMYARIWRYTSLFDLFAILRACSASSAISFLLVFFIMGSESYPRSVLLLYFMFNTIFVIGIRLSVRIYFSHYNEENLIKNHSYEFRKKIILIGAGQAADNITRDILTAYKSQYELVGFVDDDSSKHGALLHGKKVYGSINSLSKININFDEIIIAKPSATGNQMRKIIEICKSTGKHYRTVPGINELIDKEISFSVIRDVEYSDLLGREEANLDMNSIENMLQGKRVLITGAGGSIGNELVKQCLGFDPAELICLDMNEEKVYTIEQEFKGLKNKTVLKTILASINDVLECEKVFIENRPHIVFHAAAYKHVPIQELHPWNAVKTNLGGTYNIIKLADKYSVEKFVLVSTDKAVNPVNVMGATKRAAEKLIQSYNSQTKTKLMSVRFGNVLGSSGSAIPTFQRQINNGGPITITHPEMTRYFMSIQEASQLIIQCGSIGKDGEIFLLEMGQPIKITQMAKDLIRLSGLEPEKDIPIVYTGLRPGEKLYEELQLLNEKKVHTKHKKITILKESANPIPWPVMQQAVKELMKAAYELESDKIQILLKQILPTYMPRNFNQMIEKEKNNQYLKAEA